MNAQAHSKFWTTYTVLWCLVFCNVALAFCVATNVVGYWFGLGLREPDATHIYPIEYRHRGNALFYTLDVGKSLETYLNVSVFGTPLVVASLVLVAWYFTKLEKRAG